MQNKQCSKKRQRLITELQRINFGRIEKLEIKNGDPVFPIKRVIQIKKIGRNNLARKESILKKFELKEEVEELLEIFDHLQYGVIDRIDIVEGLPIKVEYASSAIL